MEYSAARGHSPCNRSTAHIMVANEDLSDTWPKQRDQVCTGVSSKVWVFFHDPPNHLTNSNLAVEHIIPLIVVIDNSVEMNVVVFRDISLTMLTLGADTNVGSIV